MKAPIQLKVLAQLLGEARADAFTLCSSPNINYASLIKPTYVPTSSPSGAAKGPEDLAGGSWPELDGTVKKGHGIVNSDVEGKKYMWKQARFGYYVPYCGDFGNFIGMCDVAWVHVGCEAADKTKNGGVGSWAGMQMFDGYLHDAEPLNPLAGATMRADKPISVILGSNGYVSPINPNNTGAPPWPGNPGGPVSPVAIIGATDDRHVRYLGAALYKKEGVDWDMKANKANTEPLTEGKYVPLVGMELLHSPEMPATYRIVPWIIEIDRMGATDDKMPFHYDEAGMAVANYGARIFSFKIDERYTADLEQTISAHWPVIWIESLSVNTTSGKVVAKVKVRPRTVAGTPKIRVSDFRVSIKLLDTSTSDTSEGILPPVTQTLTSLEFVDVSRAEADKEITIEDTISAGNLKSYKRATAALTATGTVTATGVTSRLEAAPVYHDLGSNTSENTGSEGLPLLPGSGWGPVIWPGTITT